MNHELHRSAGIGRRRVSYPETKQEKHQQEKGPSERAGEDPVWAIQPHDSGPFPKEEPAGLSRKNPPGVEADRKGERVAPEIRIGKDDADEQEPDEGKESRGLNEGSEVGEEAPNADREVEAHGDGSLGPEKVHRGEEAAAQQDRGERRLVTKEAAKQETAEDRLFDNSH